MTLELRKAVLDKAEEEAKSIISKAEEEAKRIIEEAHKLKQQEISREKEKVYRDINYEARVAEARLKARMLIAEAKNEVLKFLENCVWNYLNNLGSIQREQSLSSLMKEAVKAILEDLGGGSKVVIYVSRKDFEMARRVAKTISRELGVEIDIRESDMLGGVIAKSADERVVVDNSYEVRLKKAITVFLSELGKEVFS